MKLTALFVMLMAALALFAGAGDAAPQPIKFNLKSLKSAGKALKGAGKVFKNVAGAASAAATGHGSYTSYKESKQQG